MESSGRRASRVFLSADWRDLVMLNYEVDPALLRARVPPGTELDSFQGRTYASLVGFRFLRTRLAGRLAIPFHANFDEVNLRFYVRREAAGEERRGVVFIREIVPRRAIAVAANLFYGENYAALPMRHRIEKTSGAIAIEYRFRCRSAWLGLRARAAGAASLPAEGSLEQFITEHYWGYSWRRSGGATEYRVEHPPWRVWSASHAAFEGDAARIYRPEWAGVLERPPASAFLAEGSPVVVCTGQQFC